MVLAFEKLTRNKAGTIKDLAPSNILAGIGTPSVFTEVAIDQDQGKEIAGVIQYQIAGKTCHLIWIFVAKAFRSMGIGKALLDHLYSELQENKIKVLECRIYDQLTYNFSMKKFSDYLLSSGFDKSSSIDGTYSIEGKELLKAFTPEKRKEIESFSGAAIPFSKATPDIITDYAKSIGYDDLDTILSANKPISCFVEKHDKCIGMLAFNRSGKVISPFLLEANDKNILNSLLGNAFYNLRGSIRLKDRVLIEYDKDINEWLRLFFPTIEERKAVLLTKKF